MAKKKEEEKKEYTLTKKQSYADNNCKLDGIDLGRSIDFNNGLPISISREELEIQGTKFNEAGEIVFIPYRFMEVKSGS